MGILDDVRALEKVFGLILCALTPISAYYWLTPSYLIGILAWTSGVLFAAGIKLIFKY